MSQKQSCDQIRISRKLITMLVSHKDLSKNIKVWRNDSNLYFHQSIRVFYKKMTWVVLTKSQVLESLQGNVSPQNLRRRCKKVINFKLQSLKGLGLSTVIL